MERTDKAIIRLTTTAHRRQATSKSQACRSRSEFGSTETARCRPALHACLDLHAHPHAPGANQATPTSTTKGVTFTTPQQPLAQAPATPHPLGHHHHHHHQSSPHSHARHHPLSLHPRQNPPSSQYPHFPPRNPNRCHIRQVPSGPSIPQRQTPQHHPNQLPHTRPWC